MLCWSLQIDQFQLCILELCLEVEQIVEYQMFQLRILKDDVKGVFASRQCKHAICSLASIYHVRSFLFTK